MNRREFLKNLGLSVVAFAGAGCKALAYRHRVSSAKRENDDSQPSVIIFLVDDLGYGDLGCYGHPFIKTPNLDEFAKQGMLFTDCYAGSPICSPSRAALLTGRFPYRTGVYHLAGRTVHLRKEEKTVAELLHGVGYTTFFAGKWHLGRLGGAHPTPGDQGFDYWFATEANSGPLNPKNFVRNAREVGETKGWYCDLLVEEAINWLRERKADKPFFIEICTHEPHTPLMPPEKYSQIYDTAKVRMLEKTLGYGTVPRYPGDNTPAEKRYYYATVTQLDNAFGQLMNELNNMGLAGNTLVIFTSDNGPEYPGGSTRLDPLRVRAAGTPGGLRGMKRHLYEGGIRVPGIIRWPKVIKAGSVSNEPISSVDFLPTLCELSGAMVPKDRAIDGTSITSVFAGKRLKRIRPLCWNINYTGTPNMAMRVGDEVLVGFANLPAPEESLMQWIKTSTLTQFELYNLKTDSSQKIDVSCQQPKKYEALVSQMRQLWKEIQQEGPTWSQYGGRIKPVVGHWSKVD